jgi:ketosteroid isomerase-like protein
MLTPETARQFAEEWINAWNAHDLDRILSHYTDDFIMESPVALKRLPETGGVVKGKSAVRAYWKSALDAFPNLFFELHDFFIGVNGITLYYTNRATGKQTTEVLLLDGEGKVYQGYAFYN